MFLFSKNNDTSGPSDSVTSTGSSDVGGRVPGGPSPDTSLSSAHGTRGKHANDDGTLDAQQSDNGDRLAVAFADEHASGVGADVRRQPSVAIASEPGRHPSLNGGPAPSAEHHAFQRPLTPIPSQRDASSLPPLDEPLRPLTPIESSGPVRTVSPDPEPKPILMNNYAPTQTSGNTERFSNQDTAYGAAAGAAGMGMGATVNRVASPTPASVTPSRRTGSRDMDVDGSAFVNGAALANNAPPDVDTSVHERVASAEGELGPKEKAGIAKEEKIHGRRLSKIIRGEAKSEKEALQVAMKELAEIQKIQKASVKEEAISHTKHSRTIGEAHKAEMALLAAREANERAETSLRATEEALEASRRHARETTEMLRLKMEEIERLRAYKQADDRERIVKIKSLSGSEKHGISRFLSG
ncbi:hypothetical protein BV25DRAFT_1829925 [Artomyces pyxidatus]|uniref:Uncharacterized protein n=1 Tax=Artomyces pyxidatus TaxID=48021 RepID=A0ACB8SSI7_9AGAM|nr:hypothetical protein BV25DRAFT_1829925 [Artomyces pyxidatus]